MLPSVSMAHLQGHLLRYKNDPEGAIKGVPEMLQQKQQGANSRVNSNSSASVKSSPGLKNSNKKLSRTLTVAEIDRMYFNPQAGWDKDVPNL